VSDEGTSDWEIVVWLFLGVAGLVGLFVVLPHLGL